MKKTRKLIRLLISDELNSLEVMHQLNFKGAVKISSSFITAQQILESWHHNKTLICCGSLPESFKGQALEINVTNLQLSNTLCFDNDFLENFQRIVSDANIDIGDHRSNSSGITGTPTKEDCRYCNYIKANFWDNKINNYRITYKSEHFFVMAGLGQFVNGYFLIIPFDHVMSSAELKPSQLEELLEVIEDLKYILRLTYGCSHILVWENGTGNGGYGKAKDSIVHAHVHIVPSNLTPQKIQEKSGFSFEQITSNEILDFGDRSFLLLQGDDNSWFINDDPELYIPRQYIRMLVAEEYAIAGDKWNWRKYMYTDKILETMGNVNFALKARWEEIPSRIKQRVKDYIDLV